MNFVNSRLAAQLQRRTENYAYTDTAIYTASPSLSTLDEYGQPSTAGTQTTVSGSFTDKPALEKWGDADIQQIDGEFRLSVLEPNKGGKITITKRFGQAVTQRTFEIVGIQDRGAFGWVCALKAVAI